MTATRPIAAGALISANFVGSQVHFAIPCFHSTANSSPETHFIPKNSPMATGTPVAFGYVESSAS